MSIGEGLVSLKCAKLNFRSGRDGSRIFLIGGLSVAHRKPRPLITNNHALIIRSKFINTIVL